MSDEDDTREREVETRDAMQLIDSRLRELAWFEKREPYVRALAGAVEDGTRIELPEWRVLIDWELENAP